MQKLIAAPQVNDAERDRSEASSDRTYRRVRGGATQIGFSLIEVLVAISILTIGIVALLILFPAGIASIQTAAEFTEANRLGQAELERANDNQIQLIAGIYPNDLTTADKNPSTFLTSNPAVIGQSTDVDAFRYIEGEAVRVPAPVIDSNDPTHSVSLYTVMADPIVPASLQVNGFRWQGVSGDLSGSLSDVNASSADDLVAGQPQYLIDYVRGLILLAPESSTTPYAEPIQFTITGSDGKVYSQSLTVSAAQVGTAVSLTSLTETVGTGTPVEPPTPWVTGSDSLVRNFHQVGTAYSSSNWDNDPYEWQFYNANLGATSNPANIGVIAFNPAGAQIHGVNGQPLEAMLTYQTYDWHIISEDRQVTSVYSNVKLSLINLLAASAKDVLSDNVTKFTGLFTYSGAPIGANNPDFIILDMDKGTLLTEGPKKDYTVNYPNGSVTFVNPNGTYVNDHLRIFYHPQKDWAVSLTRAPMVYTNDPTAANTTPLLAHYSVSTDGTTMYFPLTDVGKQVDIKFTNTTTTGTTPTSTVMENLYTITSPNNLGEVALGVPTGSTDSQITVKGVSMSALVIWKENGIWRNQTISAITPSRSVTATTTLQ